MSDSVRPQRQQPTRLPHPWDSPGKNTGVGCHFLLQCMKVKSESEVAQSCPTPSDPMECSLPGSSVHGICQARVLEWVAIAFSSQPIVAIKIQNKMQFLLEYLLFSVIIMYKSKVRQEKHVRRCSFTTVVNDFSTESHVIFECQKTMSPNCFCFLFSMSVQFS